MKRKLKDSECISYKDLIYMNNKKRRLIRNGFKFINKTNKIKKILAYGIIGFGILTLPLPTGSIILIGLGLGMLGLKPNYLKKEWIKFINYRKAKRRNN